ncbi:hypothetical protein C1H46_040399 [Malus baccata]|uniref:Uncharacterized protein n=1 Tax=Malus baccata TaxID=106549 RepID=A0A540KIS3_MALBA|nr:hypothetical protein C1H46_040399 [Malus baccata]
MRKNTVKSLVLLFAKFDIVNKNGRVVRPWICLSLIPMDLISQNLGLYNVFRGWRSFGAGGGVYQSFSCPRDPTGVPSVWEMMANPRRREDDKDEASEDGGIQVLGAGLILVGHGDFNGDAMRQ